MTRVHSNTTSQDDGSQSHTSSEGTCTYNYAYEGDVKRAQGLTFHDMTNGDREKIHEGIKKSSASNHVTYKKCYIVVIAQTTVLAFFYNVHGKM